MFHGSFQAENQIELLQQFDKTELNRQLFALNRIDIEVWCRLCGFKLNRNYIFKTQIVLFRSELILCDPNYFNLLLLTNN